MTLVGYNWIDFHTKNDHLFEIVSWRTNTLVHMKDYLWFLVRHLEKLQTQNLLCFVLSSSLNRNHGMNLFSNNHWMCVFVMILSSSLNPVSLASIGLFPPLDPIDHAIYQILISPFYASLASNIGILIREMFLETWLSNDKKMLEKNNKENKYLTTNLTNSLEKEIMIFTRTRVYIQILAFSLM